MGSLGRCINGPRRRRHGEVEAGDGVGGDASSVADIEHSRVVLLPGEIPLELSGDVGLASGWQPDHDDDQLGTDISLCDLAVWGDSRSGHARDVEGRGRRSNSRGRGARVLSDGQPVGRVSAVVRCL